MATSLTGGRLRIKNSSIRRGSLFQLGTVTSRFDDDA
jgi:hypothetical protein